MDSDQARNPNHSFFPFDRLPDDIQSRILSLLPITILVLCRAVSPSWRSIIRSLSFTSSYRPPRDPIFLLYSYLDPTVDACAYLPSTDSWIDFHFQRPVSLFPPTGTSLLIADFGSNDLHIVNPFSPRSRIHDLPPVPYLNRSYDILALIQDNPSDYIIVAVKHRDGIRTQIYDSRYARWEELAPFQVGLREFVYMGNAVYLDGLLFCLSAPNRLLTFDPVRRQWSMHVLDLPIPSYIYYLLGFGGELYLTAIHGDDMVLTRIEIWKLDWSTMAWKDFDFMPNKYLAEFNALELSSLSMTDCMGMICFFTPDPKKIVMCDLAVRRWWCPQPCNIPEAGERGFTIGSAIEPHINLLK